MNDESLKEPHTAEKKCQHPAALWVSRVTRYGTGRAGRTISCSYLPACYASLANLRNLQTRRHAATIAKQGTASNHASRRKLHLQMPALGIVSAAGCKRLPATHIISRAAVRWRLLLRYAAPSEKPVLCAEFLNDLLHLGGNDRLAQNEIIQLLQCALDCGHLHRQPHTIVSGSHTCRQGKVRTIMKCKERCALY